MFIFSLIFALPYGKINFRDVKIIIPCSFYIKRKSQRPKGGAGNYE